MDSMVPPQEAGVRHHRLRMTCIGIDSNVERREHLITDGYVNSLTAMDAHERPIFDKLL